MPAGAKPLWEPDGEAASTRMRAAPHPPVDPPPPTPPRNPRQRGPRPAAAPAGPRLASGGVGGSDAQPMPAGAKPLWEPDGEAASTRMRDASATEVDVDRAQRP